MALDVGSIRKDFPILSQTVNGNRLSFLDSAASSQRPRQVIDAMNDYYELHHANVHRSVYRLAAEATALYEGARHKVAKFINSPTDNQVVFGKNATEAINLVAGSWGRANLNAGDAIVLTDIEHHSNFVPWLMLAQEKGLEIRHLFVGDDGMLDLSQLDSVLQGAKLIAFTGVSNVLGTITPVEQIAAAAKRAGAISVVDLAQWTPHMTTDVQSLNADFVAFTGHKMLGPTGIGVLWGRKELLDDMPPFLGGGSMINDVTLNTFSPAAVPARFEAGTPPIAEAVGLGAAIDYLNEIGLSEIRAHEQAITSYALDQIEQRVGDKITVFGPRDPADRAGVVSFDLHGVHPHDVGQLLGEDGVCVRAGHHCAKPLHSKLGVAATSRASFYLYNDFDDVDALCSSLIKTAEFFN